MLTKKNILLAVATLLALAMAISAILWAKSVDQQLQNPEIFGESNAVSGEQEDFLVSDFAGLLSGEDMEALYEGQDWHFTSTWTLDD